MQRCIGVDALSYKRHVSAGLALRSNDDSVAKKLLCGKTITLDNLPVRTKSLGCHLTGCGDLTVYFPTNLSTTTLVSPITRQLVSLRAEMHRLISTVSEASSMQLTLRYVSLSSHLGYSLREEYFASSSRTCLLEIA